MAAALAGAALGLTACQPGEDAGTEDAGSQNAVEITVTAALEAVDGGSVAVAFVPDAATPWAGLLVSAPADGGLDIFNADGEALQRVTGPRLNSLAVAPNFALRGESLPLIIGVDPATGSVRGYVLVRSAPTAIEAPLEAIEPEGGAAAVCFADEAPGHLDIVVLGRDAVATTWRIRDTGADLISAEQTGRFALPAPARACATLDRDIFVTGPTLGLTRISAGGNAEVRGGPAAVSVAAGTMNGRRVVIASDGQSDTLMVLSADTLSMIADVRIITGMSTPGTEQPGALAVSDASFGGTSYQSGLVAIVGDEDGRIRIVARESFARTLTLASTQTVEG